MPKGVYERKVNPIGNIKLPPRRSIEERFWSKVDQAGGPDACWPWTASLDSRGYGKFQVGTLKEPRLVQAPRVAYELTNGVTLRPGLDYVLHSCDNRLCCNPTHLHVGTHADNMAEKKERGRAPRGEAIRSAVLTEEIVLELRRLHAAGVLNMSGAARRYGVAVATIHAAVHGNSWRHLGTPES